MPSFTTSVVYVYTSNTSTIHSIPSQYTQGLRGYHTTTYTSTLVVYYTYGRRVDNRCGDVQYGCVLEHYQRYHPTIYPYDMPSTTYAMYAMWTPYATGVTQRRRYCSSLALALQEYYTTTSTSRYTQVRMGHLHQENRCITPTTIATLLYVYQVQIACNRGDIPRYPPIVRGVCTWCISTVGRVQTACRVRMTTAQDVLDTLSTCQCGRGIHTDVQEISTLGDGVIPTIVWDNLLHNTPYSCAGIPSTHPSIGVVSS